MRGRARESERARAWPKWHDLAEYKVLLSLYDANTMFDDTVKPFLKLDKPCG